MPRGQLCAAVTVGQDSWTNYWEGPLKRDNPNLGKVTSLGVQPMFALGLTDKINVIAGLPFFKNAASAGTLAAEKGWQDAWLAVKMNAFSKKMAGGQLDLLGALGVSAPSKKYTADYLPLALGLGARSVSARAIGQFRLEKGFLVGGQIGYSTRSNVRIDRDFYFVGDEAFYSDEVDMPDVLDFSATLGFLNARLKAFLTVSKMDTRSESDIRRNDMPFISNNMDASRASIFIQYYLPKRLQGWSLIGLGGQTFSGRNVGQTLSVGGGAAYQFGVFGKRKRAEK